MTVELCGRCNHANDHVGKRCRHAVQVEVETADGVGIGSTSEICPCASGIRSDVFLCQLMALQIEETRRMSQRVLDLMRVTLAAHHLRVGKDGTIEDKNSMIVPFTGMS